MKLPIWFKMWFGYKIKNVFELAKIANKDARVLEYYHQQALPYKSDKSPKENWAMVDTIFKMRADDCEGHACVDAQVLDIWGWTWTVWILYGVDTCNKQIAHAVTTFEWPGMGKYCFSNGVLSKFESLIDIFPKYSRMETANQDKIKSLFSRG